MSTAKLEVTIWNADGKVVVHEFQEAHTATQKQIDEMVAMIERGTPAHIAGMLVMQDPSLLESTP